MGWEGEGWWMGGGRTYQIQKVIVAKNIKNEKYKQNLEEHNRNKGTEDGAPSYTKDREHGRTRDTCTRASLLLTFLGNFAAGGFC